MSGSLVLFENIPWETPQQGVFQKVYTKGNQRLRLLRFSDAFVERDWCTNGHIGYVLEGEMQLDFDGKLQSYKKGDGLWINEGADAKHKVVMEKGKTVELILFEKIP